MAVQAARVQRISDLVMYKSLEPLVDRRPRWVLLANGARARVVGRDPDTGALRELESFVHPASRLHASALGHDRSGSGVRGPGHSTFEPPMAPEARERQRFAHELARRLELLALGHHLPCWALVASSPFLGALRHGIGPQAAERLVAHHDRDLTGLPLHQLEPRLRQMLPPGPVPD